MKSRTFQQSLQHGMVGESFIARWLISRGDIILPAYEKIFDTGKGPQLFAKGRKLIAPDLLSINPARSAMPTVWFECKTKSVFSWYRMGQSWVTGIDLRHYEDYLAVRDITHMPVFLLFLHTSPVPDRKDLPYCGQRKCPTGLFGGNIDRLMQQESHRSDRWGRTGMVYWALPTLKFYAPLPPEFQASA